MELLDQKKILTRKLEIRIKLLRNQNEIEFMKNTNFWTTKEYNSIQTHCEYCESLWTMAQSRRRMGLYDLYLDNNEDIKKLKKENQIFKKEYKELNNSIYQEKQNNNSKIYKLYDDISIKIKEINLNNTKLRKLNKEFEKLYWKTTNIDIRSLKTFMKNKKDNENEEFYCSHCHNKLNEKGILKIYNQKKFVEKYLVEILNNLELQFKIEKTRKEKIQNKIKEIQENEQIEIDKIWNIIWRMK